jgi:hypothetical protein
MFRGISVVANKRRPITEVMGLALRQFTLSVTEMFNEIRIVTVTIAVATMKVIIG